MRTTRTDTLIAIRAEIGHRLDRGAGAMAPAAGFGSSAEVQLTCDQVAVLESHLLRVNKALDGDPAGIPPEEVLSLADQYASTHEVRFEDGTGADRGTVTVSDVAGAIEHLTKMSASNRGWSVYDSVTGERVYHHDRGND